VEITTIKGEPGGYVPKNITMTITIQNETEEKELLACITKVRTKKGVNDCIHTDNILAILEDSVQCYRSAQDGEIIINRIF